MGDVIDLELEIKKGSVQGYEVLLHSLDKDIKKQMGPYGGPIFLNSFNNNNMGSNDYGEALSKILFNSEVLISRIEANIEIARSRSIPVRLRLHIDEKGTPLHQLLWELISFPNTPQRLTRTRDIYFSRFIPPETNTFAREAHLKKGLRALVAVASPVTPLVDSNMKIIVEDEFNLAQSSMSDIALDFFPERNGQPCTLKGLVEKLKLGVDGGYYDILYLVCHGKFSGKNGSQLLFEDEQRKSRIYEADEFIGWLFGISPRLIVLVVCDSAGNIVEDAAAALGPKLAFAGVPAVIAMHGKVDRELIKTFMPVFLKGLAEHGQFDRAITEARIECSFNKKIDWWRPVLYMSSFSGMLWKEPATPSQTGPIHSSSQVSLVPEPTAVSVPVGVQPPLERKEIGRQVPPVPQLFVGRKKELEHLRQLVLKENHPILVITGPVGIGKSALAYRLIEDLTDHYPDGQAYFDFTSQMGHDRGIDPVMVHVLHTIYPEKVLPEGPEDLKEEFDQALKEKKVVFLLENAPGATPLNRLMSNLAGCLAVVTSTQPPELISTSACIYPLEGLEEPDCMDLLRSAWQLIGRPFDYLLAKKIARACHFQPYTLRKAAQLLFHKIPPETILSQVEKGNKSGRHPPGQ